VICDPGLQLQKSASLATATDFTNATEAHIDKLHWDEFAPSEIGLAGDQHGVHLTDMLYVGQSDL
jgi:hypothetical protein